MYDDMQHIGSQARYAIQAVCMHHVYGSYGPAGPICLIQYGMQGMGSQARYARHSGRMHVYGSDGLAGPIHIWYHNMQNMGSQVRYARRSGRMYHVYRACERADMIWTCP